MKWIFILLGLTSVWLFYEANSYEPKPFTGYVVGKTYEPRHLCHDTYKTTIESTVIHVPHVPHTHHHSVIKAVFTLHIANMRDLKHITVDSIRFTKIKVLDKLTFKL